MNISLSKQLLRLPIFCFVTFRRQDNVKPSIIDIKRIEPCPNLKALNIRKAGMSLTVEV